MNPFRSNPRRPRKMEFGPELLESRELMTGGANTFAMVPGSISTANGTAAIKFTIDPAHFKLPRRSFTLGIDIVADSGSSIKPFIASVNDPHGTLVPQTFHSIYNPHLTHLQSIGIPGTTAVLTPINLFPHDPTKPVTYTVNVQALGGSSGNFLVGFYLPGDANGDGVVNKADLQIVKSERGARSNQARYSFNADANRDGRIGQIDVAYTLQNQGVSTDISPVVQANYDTSHDYSGTNRVSSVPTAHFTGTATPHATITYAEVHNLMPSTTTTADAAGKYSIDVPLADGANTDQVTVKDAFGQVISGTLSPVSYINPSKKATATTLTK